MRDLFTAAADPAWLTNPRTKLEREFATWYANNQPIVREFERRTMELYRAGASRIGMKAIAEVVRFHAAVESKGDAFKVNNSRVSFIARLMLHRHPELEGLIETRERQERDAA